MKHTMKKCMSGLVAIVLMLFVASPAFASENTIQISSDISLVKPGDSFEVRVTYGGSFNGVDMRMTFDNELVEVEDEGSGIENAIINQSGNTILMNASAVNTISAKNGNMLTIRFKAKDGTSGNAGIGVTVVDLFANDDNYNPVDLTYTVNDQLARQGGITIQNQDEIQNEKTAVVKTTYGMTEVTGLPENSSVSITDQTENTERKTVISEEMKNSEVFKDVETADILMIYDISAGDVAFVNGKGTVKIPLGDNQKDYDSYYVGRNVDGVMVWQKAQVKDGSIIYSTDQLGEVTIVGIKGNDKVSGAYQENKSLGSKSNLPYFLGGIVLVGIITAVIMVKQIKKEENHH